MRRIELEVPQAGLPRALDGLRVLLVSDLHVDRERHAALKVLDGLAGARPDVLAAVGDLVDHARLVPAVGARLARIEARAGAFAVWGNHDAFGRPEGAAPRWLREEARPLRAMAAGLAAHGVRVLTNQSARVTVRGVPVQIVGAGEPSVGLHDLDAAFAGLDPDVYTLLIAHNPDTAFALGGRRADLVLSGHTHGGQIVPPLLGPLTLRTYRSLPKPCGLMYVHGRPLLVSAGVGTSGVPLRFNAPGDVMEVTLKAGGGGSAARLDAGREPPSASRYPRTASRAALASDRGAPGG